MTPGVRPLVAGNWKMNGLGASLSEIAAMRREVDAGKAGAAEVAVCPPATLLAGAAKLLTGGALGLGAQDCFAADHGAFTGDISAPMLKDAGAQYVIVGHSERRAGHNESDAAVRAKAEAAHKAGLTVILCVGETRAEREGGRAVEVAYEPVWAIGTGLTPTPADVADMHGAIRALLRQVYGEAGGKVRILYGGSVKPTNARELLSLANVDGALVGGASLKATDFMAIAATYV